MSERPPTNAPDEHTPPAPPAPKVAALDLRARGTSPLVAWLMILGGGALLGLTMLIALVTLLVVQGSQGPTTMLTAMVIFPIFMIVGGVARLGGLRRVIVSDPELILVRTTGATRVPWADIADVSVAKDDSTANILNAKPKKRKGQPPARTLTLARANKRRIARIHSTAFDRFDDLVDEVELRSTDARGEHTRNLSREQIDAKRNSKRTALLSIVLALVFAAISGGLIVSELSHRSRERALADTGVTVLAEITDHRMHNNIAPRVEYRFTDPAGVVRENDVMVERAEWEHLRDLPAVEVVYVPADPSIHRLARGEVDSRPAEPWLMTALMFGGPLLAFIFLVGGVLGLRGYDLNIEDGRVTLDRAGDPADAHPNREDSETKPA
ncbi:MAG: hypothetical protein DHS20C14_20580 [Phycisphaeraceae bacterium]|nr:MAG: hypothetical protein DHS20C14_20580 [Phycisphaeraceae bacterium]